MRIHQPRLFQRHLKRRINDVGLVLNHFFLCGHRVLTGFRVDPDDNIIIFSKMRLAGCHK